MTESFSALRKTVQRLSEITGVGNYSSLIEKAKRLPDELSDIRRLRITTDDYHSKLSDKDREDAAAAFAIIKERRRVEGEALRDQNLAALAREIEGLRDIICGQAAKAAIELGSMARAIRAELR